MKYTFYFTALALLLTACGRHGPLTPSTPEATPYPRQYPSAEQYEAL